MTAPRALSDSDSEQLCTEHVQPSLLSDIEEVGFRNDWVHTVENEVTRGKKLRTENPSTSLQKREYDVINIKLSKPYCNKAHKHRRIDCKKNKKRNNPCLPRSKASPKCTLNSQVLKEFNHRTKIKQRKKCPMRLAELAVPTKRQCLDTWRNKSYLLPERMVERLKQYVMDQRPVVQIPDALYCFRRRKSPSSKKSLKQKAKYCKCETLQIPLLAMEARTLCAIFGHKIAEALKTPLNLALGSNFDKISEVVAMDMANIMYGRKNINKASLMNQSIHVEMSNKVTIWILSILEDACYKLLLEDIKDLEEEEGPVLDFIDDLVANVVTVCEPCSVQYESSSESSYKDEYNVTEEQCEINITPDTKSDIHEIDDSELTDAEYFNKEITKIIYNIDKGTEDEQDNECVDEINYEQLDDDRDYDTENIDEIKQFGDNSDTYENAEIREQNDIEIEGNPNEDNTGFDNTNGDQDNLDSENPELNDLNMVENIEANENNESNVSEVFEIFSEELFDDDKNKKVKFSLIDIVNEEQSKLLALADISNKLPEQNLSNEREVPWKPYSDYKSNIVFAEPNEHLLSDADELWPSDLSSPSLKASESVSKSITSLGNIIETDEKNITPPENEDKMEVTQEIAEYISVKIREDVFTNKFEDLVPSHIEIIGDTDLLLEDTDEKNILIKISSQSPITKVAKTKSIVSPQTIIDYKQSDEKLDEKSQVIAEKNNTDTTDFQSKYYFEAQNLNSNFENIEDSFYTIIEEMPIIATDDKQIKDEKTLVAAKIKAEKTEVATEIEGEKTDVAAEIKDEKTDVAADPAEDNGWIVHPVSAPSWLLHGRGEPNEDPISNPSSTIRDCNIRDWCEHLEGGFQNLELWTKWVDKIYQDIISLKYRIEFCARCSCIKRQQTTKLTKLIQNINRDTVLWRNVFQSSQVKCKTFRRFNPCDRIEAAPTACCTCKCACKKRMI